MYFICFLLGTLEVIENTHDKLVFTQQIDKPLQSHALRYVNG